MQEIEILRTNNKALVSRIQRMWPQRHHPEKKMGISIWLKLSIAHLKQCRINGVYP